MGMWTRGIAGIVGCAVGLAVLATGPTGTTWGALALRQDGLIGRLIDGARHETEPTERSIAVERVVPASSEVCWDLWTTSEGVSRFLEAESSIELGIGAPYEIYFDSSAPEGQRGSEDCRVLSYLPGRMLSFEWNAPPQFARIRDLRSRVVVMFEEVPGGTRVELTHLGFGDSDQWEQVYQYFTAAWPLVMDRFARSLRS